MGFYIGIEHGFVIVNMVFYIQNVSLHHIKHGVLHTVYNMVLVTRYKSFVKASLMLHGHSVVMIA